MDNYIRNITTLMNPPIKTGFRRILKMTRKGDHGSRGKMLNI